MGRTRGNPRDTEFWWVAPCYYIVLLTVLFSLLNHYVDYLSVTLSYFVHYSYLVPRALALRSAKVSPTLRPRIFLQHGFRAILPVKFPFPIDSQPEGKMLQLVPYHGPDQSVFE